MKTRISSKILQKLLLNWYEEEKREMPWRNNLDPYRILVSEFMLQQTQVKTVIPYFERWIKSFPTLRKLAQARESIVLKHWEGLGYYSRARNLRKAAQLILQNHSGKVPQSMDEIMKLPGVGRYTAGAVLSIAFGQKVPVLDGNVKRVLSRLFLLKENGSTQQSENILWQTMENLLPEIGTGNFNQAFMELGATVCLPKNPLCLLCPLKHNCKAQKSGQQNLYPPRKQSTPSTKIIVSAGVIILRNKVYIQKRKLGGLMGGLWEFPGGKLESEESPEQCLQREIKEELGIAIKIDEKLMTVKHSYTRFHVTLHVFMCKIQSGKVSPTQCEDFEWVKIAELDTYPFPAANVKIIKSLMKNH
ncbi:MAG TPA: A/G-specific adenine glycosylase [Nitrospinaceae bacterium]|jgi:A/G-specific adenine glycosylase|nr:A/G-specific adenine glycosylase [Nitrospinaceae bacterium]HIK58553.1 A/G-specific adenine glycosylase [Nitrospinaceae bacterium]